MSVIDKVIITNENKNELDLPHNYMVALKNLLKNVATFLNKNRIEWWSDGGTSLGAIREGGQIPHDNDLDFAVDKNNFTKILTLCETIHKKFSYTIRAYEDLIKIFSHETTHNGVSPCLDIFLYTHREGKIQPVQYWKNCYYLRKELKPLKKRNYKIGGEVVEIWTAKNPIPYFDRYYGKNWRTPICDVKKYHELEEKC